MSPFAETATSSPTRLELSGVLAGALPARVYRAFTDAELIATWWAEQAEVEPVVGGGLVARWPAMGWTMRGVYTDLDPGRAVGFTWSWDHEPDTPARSVRVVLAPADDGTQVTLSHGDYGPGDERERISHLEGWQHFLPRLGEALSG